MLKLLRNLAFGFAVGISGFALAQVVSSFQLNQDPRGHFGTNSDGTHLIVAGPAPVLTSCGTTPTVVGNDMAGLITTGSGATTCTATFAKAYVVAPACVVTIQGSVVATPTYTTTTAAIVFTVDIASTAYAYVCMSTG